MLTIQLLKNVASKFNEPDRFEQNFVGYLQDLKAFEKNIFEDHKPFDVSVTPLTTPPEVNSFEAEITGPHLTSESVESETKVALSVSFLVK